MVTKELDDIQFNQAMALADRYGWQISELIFTDQLPDALKIQDAANVFLDQFIGTRARHYLRREIGIDAYDYIKGDKREWLRTLEIQST